MTAHFTLPRQVATDEDDNVVIGAKLYFFDEGTTNPRTVYSDYSLSTAHGVFVETDDKGIFPPIYPPYGNYDVLMTDGTDDGNDYTQEGALRAKITTQGPVDLTAFQSTEAVSKTESSPVAVDTTIVAADWGKAFDVNPTSATRTMTLPSAAAVGVGNGFEVTAKHIGTANAVLFATVNSETIDGQSGYAITRPGGSVTLRSDGANWRVKVESLASHPITFGVEDRSLTAPPVTPVAGGYYIMPSGTLTGLWSGFSENDLIVHLGSGSYSEVTKLEGDRAYIKDENFDSVWNGSAWVDHSNVTAPNTSTLKSAVFEVRENNNSNGGTSVATTWTDRGLNTETSNTITGASLDTDTGIFTLPEGSYLMIGFQAHAHSPRINIRVKSTTTSKEIESVNSYFETASVTSLDFAGTIPLAGTLVLDAEESFELQYYRGSSNSTTDLGWASNNGGDEIYAQLTIIDMTSIQGPQGIQGLQGVAGSDGDDGDDGLDGFGEIFVQSSEPGSFQADNALWIRTTDGQVFISASGVMVDQSYSVKGDTGNTGPVGMNWRGAYDNGTEYVENDVVSESGISYICTATTTGNTPPNASYWDVLADKGADGADGGGLADVVDDTTPQLGGDLDCNGNNITDLNIGSDASGDILYHDGTAYTRLAKGANGEVLKLSAGLPSWAAESGGSGGTSTDLLNLILRVADLEGDRLNFEDGIADPFDDETDVDTTASTNESYDSGNDLYSPDAGTPQSDGAPSGTYNATSFTLINRGIQLTGGRTVTAIGINIPVAVTIAIKIVKRNSSSNYDIISSESFSHTGSGWEDFTLSSPYEVPASGEYYTACYVPADTAYVSALRSYHATDIAVGTGFSTSGEDTGPVRATRIEYEYPDMTLISEGFTADSEPDTGRICVLAIPNESITLNTDLIASISRDDGTTFSTATLVAKITNTDGSILYEDSSVDISSQPSGTDMVWKVETANGKDVDVSGVVLQWS